jgi:3-oxoacyl-[acyl-carrier protein] reductase
MNPTAANSTAAAASENTGPSRPFDLSERVALVTGSSKGLGRAMALALGQAGAKVAMNYCNDVAKAEKAFADFKSRGCEGMLVRADVTNEQEVSAALERIRNGLGPIDILIVNATCDQPHRRIEDYEWAFFQTMLDFLSRAHFF